MDGSIRGMPLLSGPAPTYEDPHRSGCRKCGKEFGLFTRSKTCGHCGYSYCSSCADHQALMPRTGPESGYQSVHVCGYCIDNLTVTASGRQQLRALSVAKLRKYTSAYGIQVPGVLEKDDIVEAVMAARGPNGCLPREKEDYYRRHSVPNKEASSRRRTRDIFGRSPSSTTTPSRPNQSSQPPPPETQQYTPRTPQQRAQQQTPPRNNPPPRPNPHRQAPPQQQQQTRNHIPPQQQQQPQPQVPRAPPAPVIPSLVSLMDLTAEQLSSLSIGVLKGVLTQNHVNARLVLEKNDLVAKVRSLIEAERVERETEARIHAMEEEEMRARREASTVHPQRSPPTITPLNTFHPEAGAEAGPFIRLEEETEDDRSPTHAEPPLRPSIIDENTPILERATPMLERTQLKPATSDIGPPLAPPVTEPIPPKIDPKPNPAPVATGLPLERDGLCVVCQDEAANIAIVDCGHLALCMGCSDIIMKTTRECPLCRTRIVTDARLLRIFKS